MDFIFLFLPEVFMLDCFYDFDYQQIVQAYETLMRVPNTQVSTNMAEMEEAGDAELIQA